MNVATKTVTDRRKLRFETLDDLLADARQVATGEVTMLGNWTLAQILGHLAIALRFDRWAGFESAMAHENDGSAVHEEPIS
jgi:hypothetical protein